jgi:DNA-cytosine methyltransferase
VLTVGGLFDGCGLLAYGLHLAGLRHAWLCEVDPWRRSLLLDRFRVPVARDIRDVGAATAPRVDVIAGGFPCKGNSTAGKRTGLEHPETALWHEMARVVGELQPRFVVVENVANLLAVHDGAVWGTVLGDLAALGYRVWWDCFPAAAFGAPHLRDRVFAIAAHPDRVAGAEGEPRLLPTPLSRATERSPERHAAARAEMGRQPSDLRAVVSLGEPTGPQSADGKPRSAAPRLNPSFVEWMMGAPAGWTDPACRLSVTEFSSRPASTSDGS